MWVCAFLIQKKKDGEKRENKGRKTGIGGIKIDSKVT
jgi:hypothetical protein